jgi:hypothetical protein
MYYLLYYLERPDNKDNFNQAVGDCIMDLMINVCALCKFHPILGEIVSELFIVPCNYALRDEEWKNFKMWHFCDALATWPKILQQEELLSPRMSRRKLSISFNQAPDQISINQSKDPSLREITDPLPNTYIDSTSEKQYPNPNPNKSFDETMKEKKTSVDDDNDSSQEPDELLIYDREDEDHMPVHSSAHSDQGYHTCSCS